MEKNPFVFYLEKCAAEGAPVKALYCKFGESPTLFMNDSSLTGLLCDDHFVDKGGAFPLMSFAVDLTPEERVAFAANPAIEIDGLTMVIAGRRLPAIAKLPFEPVGSVSYGNGDRNVFNVRDSVITPAYDVWTQRHPGKVSHWDMSLPCPAADRPKQVGVLDEIADCPTRFRVGAYMYVMPMLVSVIEEYGLTSMCGYLAGGKALYVNLTENAILLHCGKFTPSEAKPPATDPSGEPKAKRAKAKAPAAETAAPTGTAPTGEAVAPAAPVTVKTNTDPAVTGSLDAPATPTVADVIGYLSEIDAAVGAMTTNVKAITRKATVALKAIEKKSSSRESKETQAALKAAQAALAALIK